MCAVKWRPQDLPQLFESMFTCSLLSSSWLFAQLSMLWIEPLPSCSCVIEPSVSRLFMSIHYHIHLAWRDRHWDQFYPLERMRLQSPDKWGNGRQTYSLTIVPCPNNRRYATIVQGCKKADTPSGKRVGMHPIVWSAHHYLRSLLGSLVERLASCALEHCLSRVL